MDFEIGYDIDGRRVIIDSCGNYVTHIPNYLTTDEVIARLRNGIRVYFDGYNQGMQNIPGAQYGGPVVLAPREEWPLHEAWEQRWFTHIDDEMTFDEFREMYYNNLQQGSR